MAVCGKCADNLRMLILPVFLQLFSTAGALLDSQTLYINVECLAVVFGVAYCVPNRLFEILDKRNVRRVFAYACVIGTRGKYNGCLFAEYNHLNEIFQSKRAFVVTALRVA